MEEHSTKYMTHALQKCWGALDSGVFVLQLRKLQVSTANQNTADEK